MMRRLLQKRLHRQIVLTTDDSSTNHLGVFLMDS